MKVSSPGRICLFGEHQDYLGLPVVAAAIDIRARFEAVENGESVFRINLPDIDSELSFDPRSQLNYSSNRDYLLSGVNILIREGYKFEKGRDIVFKSDIPIGKGCSSSSAMLVAWIGLLCRIATEGPALAPSDCARLAHRAEVLEFGEPGGMMDHYASAIGGLLLVETSGEARALQLDTSLEGLFVLGDSLQPKDTTGVLGAAKNNALLAMDLIRKSIPTTEWNIISAKVAAEALHNAPMEAVNSALGNIDNRNIAEQAIKMLRSDYVAPNAIGALLTRQHRNLSRLIGVSTAKIDGMVDSAISAGAWGAKINGSGGGGCMFAYTNMECADAVEQAISDAGGAPRRVCIDNGFREDAE
jgi:galactokinase